MKMNNLQFILGHHPQRLSAKHTGTIKQVLAWGCLQGPLPLLIYPPNLLHFVDVLYGRPFTQIRSIKYNNSTEVDCKSQAYTSWKLVIDYVDGFLCLHG